MKALIVTILALALAACSSPGSKQANHPDPAIKPDAGASRLAESAFDGSSGTLNLVFDEQGNWVKITSKGTASLSADTSSGRETALMIATMRAKRTVTEFLSNDVKSTKTLTRVARSYARAFQSEETADPGASTSNLDTDAMDDLDMEAKGAHTEKARQAQHLATILTERIQDNSAAILKGSYVSLRVFEGEQVIVELTTTRHSIAAAHQVSGMMRGTLQ
ncbi:MAG: hypothetical protein Q8N48_03885 [Thiobacillus sp.]|nr:hypothetical protein [Thiobacillus sp.]